MADPEQTDLIDYLADDAAKAVSHAQFLAGSAAKQSVHNEHLASVPGSASAGECVHNEHTFPATRIEAGEAAAEPNAPAAPMSPYRLAVCLAIIGWSERELARRTGRLQTTVRRWTAGSPAVPAEVAAWVEAMAAFHRAHPAPRVRPGLPE